MVAGIVDIEFEATESMFSVDLTSYPMFYVHLALVIFWRVYDFLSPIPSLPFFLLVIYAVMRYKIVEWRITIQPKKKRS